MIRVGIAGGTNPVAGELIRILINHPDVELLQVCDPVAEGAPVSAVHRGLANETFLTFAPAIEWQGLDMLFMCGDDSAASSALVNDPGRPESVRLIDFSPLHRLPAAGVWPDPDVSSPDPAAWCFGLPELARKPMVRGARYASVPTTTAHAILLGLLPLAKNGLLDSDITVHAAVADHDALPGETLALIDCDAIDEVTAAVRTLSLHFNSRISITVINGGWTRGIVANIQMRTATPIARIREMYQEFYRDHNFTILTDTVPVPADVSGTNKALVYLDKVGDSLAVTVVMDDALKGSAGTAVHDMNLLFGLQEQVGLMLKANGI